MSDDEPRDDLDELLRRRLRDTVAAPRASADSPAERLEELRPRFGRARRRRQMATGAVGVAAAVVLVGLVGSLSGGGQARVNTPAGPSPTTRPSLATTTTSTSAPAPATTLAPDPTTAPTTVPGGSTQTVPGRSTTTTRPSTAGSATTTTVPVAPVETTLPALGGSVVVRYDAATVTLMRSVPAAGWRVSETKTEIDRVEVRFRRDGSSEESKVIARLDNGRFRTEVS